MNNLIWRKNTSSPLTCSKCDLQSLPSARTVTFNLGAALSTSKFQASESVLDTKISDGLAISKSTVVPGIGVYGKKRNQNHSSVHKKTLVLSPCVSSIKKVQYHLYVSKPLFTIKINFYSFYIFPIWITNNIRISAKIIWFKKLKGPQKSLFWTRILVVFTWTTRTIAMWWNHIKKNCRPQLLLRQQFYYVENSIHTEESSIWCLSKLILNWKVYDKEWYMCLSLLYVIVP